LADAIDEFIDRIGSVVSWLALAVALLMGANVFLRYGFAIGSIWSQELEWYLLVPLTLVGISYALRHGEHVRVDVLFTHFSPRAKKVVDLISAVLGLVFSLLVIWLSIGFVRQSWALGEGSPNPGGIPALYVIKAMIPVGFALIGLQSLAETLRLAVALRTA
jgi:TRAP-type mannitol/chloroaromatic compound transport system permease small subunit